MSENNVALIWTESALGELIVMTTQKAQKYSEAQTVGSAMGMMWTCMRLAREEGATCVTKDLAARVRIMYEKNDKEENGS